jgi:hypothetical protein
LVSTVCYEYVLPLMSDSSGRRWLPRLAATSIAILAVATAAFVGFLLWWSAKVGSIPPERATAARVAVEQVATQPRRQARIEAPPAVPTVPPPEATPVTLTSAPPAVGSSSSSDIEKNKAIARGLAGLANDPQAAARFGIPP